MENSLAKRIGTAAFAFRGYDVSNLGRSPELLDHPRYGPVLEQHLREASEVCANAVGRRSDLVSRVRERAPSTLKSYPQDLASIVAVQLAQIRILDECFGIAFQKARLAFGYSLGEVAAVIAAGVYRMEDVLPTLLIHAKDAARLATNVTMGVLFSRGPALDFDAIRKLCLRVTQEGDGVVAVSTYLSPNTVLLMGQGKSIDRFETLMHEVFPKPVHLKRNPHRWPPMHTPIVWQKNIPNRVGVMLAKAAGGFTAPVPPILSCVTGEPSYNDYNSREILNRWVDHPQKLWDVVDRTLAEGVELVVHIGPEPNITPATFRRLSNNVAMQLGSRTLSGLGLRAVSRIVRRHRPWLKPLLSSDATLLRAPFVEQLILEDWLLEHPLE